MELNVLIQNSAQQEYLLELYLFPCIRSFTKREQNKLLWLIIAGSPSLSHFTKGWVLEFCLVFKKNRRQRGRGRVNFPFQREKLLSGNNLWLLLIFAFVNSKSITIWVLIKTHLSEIYVFFLAQSLFQEQVWIQYDIEESIEYNHPRKRLARWSNFN